MVEEKKYDGEKLVHRVDEALKEIGKNRKDVLKKFELNLNTFRDWNKGRIPAADKILKIAKYLNVSVEWLIEGKDKEGLTLKERNLIVKYSSLSERDQFEVDALIEAKLTVMADQKILA